MLLMNEFVHAIDTIARLTGETLDPEECWNEASDDDQHVNWPDFLAWVVKHGMSLPHGVDANDSVRRCRFTHADGSPCECQNFQPSSGNPELCICGHKNSMHRSDAAELSATHLLSDARSLHWVPDRKGLVNIEAGTPLFNQLQDMLNGTHKTTDNWTRDRGCRIHGVNGRGCNMQCLSKNRAAVPKQYRLIQVSRNQNPMLWAKYDALKTSISTECRAESSGRRYEKVSVDSQYRLDSPLDDTCNEWRLFHGSGADACEAICGSNFRLSFAGKGCTWKEEGKDAGMPLYGKGLYFAEKITKADEYAGSLPAQPDDNVASGEIYCVLICRVIGGRANVVTTNEIDAAGLREQVWDGPYHSVLGDRVKVLKKPYREVVVYDKDQVYPEFMLLYERVMS